MSAQHREPLARPRVSDLGITLGAFSRGPLNAITDVPGVRIGHRTITGQGLNTGVTAIVPEPLGPERRMLPAGLCVGNGYGKMIGVSQILELGAIETPILLTSTLSAFRVADALVSHVIAQPGYEKTTTLNPVVGETNDGFLSDIRARRITEGDVFAALGEASDGPVAEGAVGAGTGTVALGYKGGIGTASRRVVVGDEEYTVGAIVQSNFTGTLTVAGVPLPATELLDTTPAETIGNSCMIVVATDAPLDARQLGRVARRAVFAMRAVGADYAQGSGDYAITFSVGQGTPPNDDLLSPTFQATMDAVEEALLNSVFAGVDTAGFEGRSAAGLPLDDAIARLRAAGVAPTD